MSNVQKLVDELVKVESDVEFDSRKQITLVSPLNADRGEHSRVMLFDLAPGAVDELKRFLADTIIAVLDDVQDRFYVGDNSQHHVHPRATVPKATASELLFGHGLILASHGGHERSQP